MSDTPFSAAHCCPQLTSGTVARKVQRMKAKNAQPVTEALTAQPHLAEWIKHAAADGQDAQLRTLFTQVYTDCDHDWFDAALSVRYIVTTLIAAPAYLYSLPAHVFVTTALNI